MKKPLFFSLILVAILAAGGYWWMTRQIASHMDDLATTLRPVGSLSYDAVRVSPGGAAYVVGIRFVPFGMAESVEVERVSITAENLWRLWRMSRDFEDGFIPSKLRLSLNGLKLSLDGQLVDGVEGGAFGGLLFDAAGCGDRREFSAMDLTGMDYWDLLLDASMAYRLENDGERIVLSMTSRGREMSELSATTTLELNATSRRVEELTMAFFNARLESVHLSYRDLGFYPRMLDFCAAETGMSLTDYRDHHARQWRERWSEIGLEPGPEATVGYQRFLSSPEQIEIRLEPRWSMPVSRLASLDESGWIGETRIQFAVNYGSMLELDIATLGSDLPEPAEDATRADPTRPVTTASTERPSFDPYAGWQPVSFEHLTDHHQAAVIVLLKDGSRVTGHLMESDDREIHVRVRGVGGFFIRPYERDRIAEVRVR